MAYRVVAFKSRPFAKPPRKLTDDQIRAIRFAYCEDGKLRGNKVTFAQLAKQYHVSLTPIQHAIRCRHCYTDVPRTPIQERFTFPPRA